MLVGYEMIIANLALHTSLAIYHLISNMLLWNNLLLSAVNSKHYITQINIKQSAFSGDKTAQCRQLHSDVHVTSLARIIINEVKVVILGNQKIINL